MAPLQVGTKTVGQCIEHYYKVWQPPVIMRIQLDFRNQNFVLKHAFNVAAVEKGAPRVVQDILQEAPPLEESGAPAIAAAARADACGKDLRALRRGSMQRCVRYTLSSWRQMHARVQS
jgi:hypothetical protein